MRTHMSSVDRGNESNPYDEWYDTFCGLEYTESPLTDKEQFVTCKNCLKVITKAKLNSEKYKKENGK